MPPKKHKYYRSPLVPLKRSGSACFEITDSSVQVIEGTEFLRGAASRDIVPQAARLSQQFLNQNAGVLRDFGIASDLRYDGSDVRILLKAGTRIGAFPLLSPTTGKPDYGLVIRPRFDWPGIGPMLAAMGWRVIPTPLRLPLLPRSERKIPPWVLSTIILVRLKALLERLERRFELIEENLPAPHGTVNWSRYAISGIGAAKFLDVPCSFPDLRDDATLKSAIHFTLLKHLNSLEGQRTSGIIVLHLIGLCQSLIDRVKLHSPKQPTTGFLDVWHTKRMTAAAFRDGIQAIEWTVEDRGLAGVSDLEGIPWIMSMEEFFEAWLEVLVSRLARQIGGVVRIGRRRETITPLMWDPPYIGSQKFLLPDVVLERENDTIIFDAKYKEHWEELNRDQWSNLDEEIRERHRADLLQILAYSTLHSKKRLASCLVYPCHHATWESLKNRGRLFHKAQVRSGDRSIDLILTAIPMHAALEECVTTIAHAVA